MKNKNLIQSRNMKNLPDFFKQSKRDAFSFSDQRIVDLLNANKEKISVGSATSDFQAEPLVYDSNGKPVIVSDWEQNIFENINGKKSSIVTIQDSKQFPRFLENKELYFNRSQELGQTMFRFSLDFGRLCPKPFEFNETLMQEYATCLAEIKFRGQEPMIALYHWPMPLYLLEINADGTVAKGGWEHPDVIEHFSCYVRSVIAFLADKEKIKKVLDAKDFPQEFKDRILSEGLCGTFITINEPMSILPAGYLSGWFPPYKKARLDLVMKVLKKLVQAHDSAFDIIKKTLKYPTRVGIAHIWPYFDGTLSFLHKFVNEYVTDKFERDGTHTDFLGMQYYSRFQDPFADKSKRLYGNHPDFGDVYPRGLFENLKIMTKRYPNKEIMITEFGFSEHTDLKKPFLILETIRHIIEALQENIPIKGILIWTLVDNFEWAQGMNSRFGFWSEEALKNPLQYSQQGSIKSFEAWQSVVRAISQPTRENLETLQADYQVARNQFEQSYQ